MRGNLLSEVKDETSAMEVKEYKPGEIIIPEGEERDCFFVILKGEVTLSQNNKLIRVLKEDDVFGLESVFLKKPFTTTAKTITSARIAAYGIGLLRDLIYDHPALIEKILSSLVAQLEQTTQVAEENIELAKLIDFNEKVYQDGEIIIEEGSEGIDFYRLIETEGGLLITKGGKEIGRISEPGEYFGEMSSLLSQRRTATVRSIGRSVVQVFPGENLEAALEAYPSLAKKIIDTLAYRLAEASKKIAEKGE